MTPPRTRRTTHHARAQKGIVLLEALVAILIFSLGILGLIGLQAVSIQNTSESQFRVEAANLANTVLAQIRTADPLTRVNLFQTNGGSVTVGYTAWYNRVADPSTGLPGAAVAANRPTVVFSGAGNDTVTVTMIWQAKTDSGTRQHVVTTLID